MSDCYIEPCTDHITLYINDTEIDSASQTDITKYERLLDTRDQKLNILSSTQSTSSGFYFGIRDSGLCGLLGRVIIYYKVCLGRQSGLVVYPETALPPSNGPMEYFDASCVQNAHNITSLQIIANGASGTCSSGAKCECNLGYFERNGECLGKLSFME